MEKPLPTIDEVLRPFFATRLDGATGIKRKRTEQIEALLREYLEADCDKVFTPFERSVVAAERQFSPDGAVCRTMNAEVLLFSLLGFLDPSHLPPDPLLRRAQLSIVESLIAGLVRTDLAELDTVCFQYDLRAALDRAQAELNSTAPQQQDRHH
ncbi:hypothetical protein [Salinibacterium sp. ZJ450]|uniref:hypothetical protein n=1 Tax=Salinibacterium sp. ZJ450 TaxID=2708338 RepID=UPI0014249E52|nr:hypothetical protein [Salinibacterium sp. ZJ450]